MNPETLMAFQIGQIALWHREWREELAHRFAPFEPSVARLLRSSDEPETGPSTDSRPLFNAELAVFEHLYQIRFRSDEHFLITDGKSANRALLKFQIFLTHQWVFLKRCRERVSDPALLTLIGKKIRSVEEENAALEKLCVPETSRTKKSGERILKLFPVGPSQETREHFIGRDFR